MSEEEAIDPKALERAQKKKVKELVRDLYATDETIVLAALAEIPEWGDETVVPGLIDLLVDEGQTPEVREKAQKILFSLKTEKALAPLIHALESDHTEGYRHLLVSAIWQSGLQAQSHLTFLVDLAINENFLTCFECLTVIENMERPQDDQEILENVAHLREASGSDPEKDPLYTGIIETLGEMVVG